MSNDSEAEEADVEEQEVDETEAQTAEADEETAQEEETEEETPKEGLQEGDFVELDYTARTVEGGDPSTRPTPKSPKRKASARTRSSTRAPSSWVRVISSRPSSLTSTAKTPATAAL